MHAKGLSVEAMHSSLVDIDPKADPLYVAILRRLSSWEKANLIAGMADSGRELVLLNVRKQHPDADERTVFRYLADRMLGPDLALRAYGPLPEA